MSANFVGGYACKLVNTPPVELQTECSICLQLLRDPAMVYKFCNSCITPGLRRRQPCPLCGERNITTMADRQLQRTLNGLQVYCSQVEGGCDWEGKLMDLEQHLNWDYTSDNWLEGCGSVSVECPACEEQCPREEGRSHMQDECPEAQVPCSFSHIGCQETLPRKQMQNHVQGEMSSHMMLLLSHTQKLATEYNKKSIEIMNTIDNLQVTGGDTVPSGEISRIRKQLQRGSKQRTGTRSAIWWAAGFIAAALLAALLAINTGESPFSGQPESKDGTGEIANFKLTLLDLEQKLAVVSESLLDATACDGQAEKLRAKLETIESTSAERLEGVLQELAVLKAVVDNLSSKENVDKLKVEVKQIQDDLVATKQRLEALPSFPDLLPEVHRLVQEELEKRPHPPHGRHDRHKRHHHGCHH